MTKPYLVVLVVLALASLPACQDDVSTPFPAGLEPFEDNAVPDTTSPDEVLRTVAVPNGGVGVHGRGLVHASPEALWTLAQDPAAMVARCSTDSQTIMPNTEPAYVFSFLVHYVVNNILTVEWDDQWRYGVITGEAPAVELGMIRHQKIKGSDFITLSEGTVQVIATDDPAITELAFVEHLDAVMGSTGDLVAGMQANYDALVALAHGAPIPNCP